MNKLLLIALLVLSVVVADNVIYQPTEAASESTAEDVRSTMTRCHESCICANLSLECASCNQCTDCVQTRGTKMVNQDFCQCLTPDWVQGRGPNGEWICVEVVHPDPKPIECEWQLFNQIYRMVVHSNCSLQVDTNEDGSQTNYIVDNISFDWRRLSDALNISEDCKRELTSKLLWSQSCNGVYVPLNTDYYENTDVNHIHFQAKLIDVYSLSATAQLSVDERTIYQRICLAIELGNERKVLRQHRFELRVYTNRDQVEVFHLNVDIQYTEGCDLGQECIIVANLDTKGRICDDSSCGTFKPDNYVPTYTIGDHLYVRIEFKDTDYTKFLQVQTVKFIDSDGIYTYTRGVQWGVLRSLPAKTDIDVYLFQPQFNALVEVALKIALVADHVDVAVPPSAAPSSGLRSLQSKDTAGEITTQSFKNVTVNSKANNASADNFSAQLFCGFALAALALLF